MATSAPLYEQTSQYRNWRFSPEKLHEIRKLTNQAGIERARRNIKAEENEQQHREATTPAVPAKPEGDINYLSLEDELTLCHFYETKIEVFSKHFKLPLHVKAAAIMYMKRFFLFNTVLDYPPKNIMVTCLYLATKTENRFISIDDFAKPIPKTGPKDILDYEFVVSQSLKFEFAVHPPYSALYGFYLDAQDTVNNMAQLTQIYVKALEYCNTSLYTDLTFIYFPSQIALACMRQASEEVGWDFNLYLHRKHPDVAAATALTSTLDAIRAVLKAYKPVTAISVRDIDRRLIYCRNPEKDPNSLLYRLKKEKDEKEADHRRLEKYNPGGVNVMDEDAETPA